ncbi:MAG: phage antirepressor KilAC domain-containing protein [Shinella sp.]|uniref:phage antirepressor KilAC domain-containing protein n=1 Tax=Shinella sp. TaxID=1870904 RepID=UPI003C762F56
MIPISAALTMSSREIADLTGKRHDNVMRVCRDLRAGGITPQIEEFPFDHNGNTYFEFKLSKRDSLVLVARLSPEFTARVVDRWIELESQFDGSNVTFLVPKSLPEALRLAADLAEKVEEQNAVIGIMKPKASFHDAVTSAVNCQTVQEAAKLIGTGQNRLFKKLREAKLLMNDNQPYQSAIEVGYFRMVEGQYKDKRGESHTYTRTLVTGKGLAYIQKHFGSAA